MISPEYLTPEARAEAAARVREWMDDDHELPIPTSEWGLQLSFDLKVLTTPDVSRETLVTKQNRRTS